MANNENYSVELLRSVLDLILTFCSTIYTTSEQQPAKGKGHIVVKKFLQCFDVFS